MMRFDCNEIIIRREERKAELEKERSRGKLKTDRYELLGELGRGAWGVVYEANDKVMGKKVAIKILEPSELARKQMKERNLDDFKAMQKEWALAPCANVVPRSFESDGEGKPYIVMPVYEQFLEEVLKDSEPVERRASVKNGISLETAINLLKDTANGLAEMHEKMGRAHGDLKPDNIALDSKGRALISDLGTSTCASFFGRSESPRDNMGCVDTRAYECFKREGLDAEAIEWPIGGKNGHPDKNTDSYAWAALAYRIFSGKYPWEDELKNMKNPAKYFESLGAERVDSIIRNKVRKNIPKKFRKIIQQGLSFNPYQRLSFNQSELEKNSICSELGKIAEDISFVNRLKRGFRKWTVNIGLPLTLLGGLVYHGATYEPERLGMPEKPRINGMLYKNDRSLKEEERIEFETENIKKLPETPTGMIIQGQQRVAKQVTDNRVVAYLVKTEGQAFLSGGHWIEAASEYQRNMYIPLTTPNERERDRACESKIHPVWARTIEHAIHESKTNDGKIDLEDVMAISRVGSAKVAEAKRVSGSQDYGVYRNAKDGKGNLIIPKGEASLINAWLAYYHTDVD